jgi:hypothetical protein
MSLRMHSHPDGNASVSLPSPSSSSPSPLSPKTSSPELLGCVLTSGVSKLPIPVRFAWGTAASPRVAVCTVPRSAASLSCNKASRLPVLRSRLAEVETSTVSERAALLLSSVRASRIPLAVKSASLPRVVQAARAHRAMIAATRIVASTVCGRASGIPLASKSGSRPKVNVARSEKVKVQEIIPVPIVAVNPKAAKARPKKSFVAVPTFSRVKSRKQATAVAVGTSPKKSLIVAPAPSAVNVPSVVVSVKDSPKKSLLPLPALSRVQSDMDAPAAGAVIKNPAKKSRLPVPAVSSVKAEPVCPPQSTLQGNAPSGRPAGPLKWAPAISSPLRNVVCAEDVLSGGVVRSRKGPAARERLRKHLCWYEMPCAEYDCVFDVMIYIWFWNSTKPERKAAEQAKLELEEFRDAAIVAVITSAERTPVVSPFRSSATARAAVLSQSQGVGLHGAMKISSGVQGEMVAGKRAEGLASDEVCAIRKYRWDGAILTADTES